MIKAMQTLETVQHIPFVLAIFEIDTETATTFMRKQKRIHYGSFFVDHASFTKAES